MSSDDRAKMEENAGDRLSLLAESFQRLTGKPLTSDGSEMWNAPRVILAHDTQVPPRFFYGNRQALALFKLSATQMIGMESYKSAEADLREERAAMLAQLQETNVITDYQGIRIASDGNRFAIEKAIVWNLIDADGARHGQAATFDSWAQLPN